MLHRSSPAALFGLVACCGFGCTGPLRVTTVDGSLAPFGGNPALFAQFRAYDGHTGRPLTYDQLAAHVRDADLVVFGEQHNDVVCNQLEAQLFHELTSDRRATLAMEFLESDTQPTVDAYLAGRLGEPAYRDLARQSRHYPVTHRPLVELAGARDCEVIAANAPRRLVRAYRRSGEDFATFRATLPAEERRWLPAATETLEGPYRDRFFALMGGFSSPDTDGTDGGEEAEADEEPQHEADDDANDDAAAQPEAGGDPSDQQQSAPGSVHGGVTAESLFRAQCLWDDAMADAVARARRLRPDTPVMLVVGVFHVADGGGTVVKLHRQRPHDRLLTVAYRGAPDADLSFRDEDRGAGDIVIYGVTKPPPERRFEPPTIEPAETEAPASPHPTTKPATGKEDDSAAGTEPAANPNLPPPSPHHHRPVPPAVEPAEE